MGFLVSYIGTCVFYLCPLSAQAGVNEPTRISLVLDIAECAEDLEGCGLGTCIFQPGVWYLVLSYFAISCLASGTGLSYSCAASLTITATRGGGCCSLPVYGHYAVTCLASGTRFAVSLLTVFRHFAIACLASGTNLTCA